MTFQSLAEESANIYLDYLKEQQKGTSDIPVIGIHQNIKIPELFTIALSRTPYSPDSLLIKINGHICKKEEIHPVEYDKKTKQLTVRAFPSFISILKNADPMTVFVSSDLTFLVERVKNWYKKFGDMIKLPQKTPEVRNLERDNDKTPSPDQTAAIEGILSNPFTYVWGAPGTGKTQVVLSESIISYITSGKKVLVTAPTNNALEQTLNGLLPVMTAAGLDYNELVIRLGIPSSDFAERYPGVCESIAEAHKLSELNDRISILENKIQDTEYILDLFPKYRNFLISKEALQKFVSASPALLKDIMDLFHKQKYYEAEITRIEGRIVLDSEKSKRLQKEEHQYTEKIRLLTEKIKRYKSNFSKKLHAKKIRLLSNELSGFVAEEEKAHNRVFALDNAINENKQKITDYQKTTTEIPQRISDKMDSVLELARFHAELHSRIEYFYVHLDDATLLELNAMTEDIQQRAEEKEKLFAKIKEVSETELQKELAALRLEHNDCLSLKASFDEDGELAKRSEKCKVIAVTVDSCLNRLRPNENNNFSHVFLDEAGYCSLIKGCTLFAFGTPVTFLGDHMQLPPICEMPDSKIYEYSNRPVFLWAQSALYSESVLKKKFDESFSDFVAKKDASFDFTKKYDLIRTFRFGSSLASVLANEVYAKDFYGTDTHETELLCIDAPKLKTDKKRTSTSERNAIQAYVATKKDEDIGIITPYREQIKLLKQQLDSHLTDSIVTVHGSQGREWDTVLFSVVDTTDKFFVDSLNQISDGKKLVNTAVSRARKRIVIVCDYAYWITQKNQLICRILEKAKIYQRDDLKDNLK